MIFRGSYFEPPYGSNHSEGCYMSPNTETVPHEVEHLTHLISPPGYFHRKRRSYTHKHLHAHVSLVHPPQHTFPCSSFLSYWLQQKNNEMYANHYDQSPLYYQTQSIEMTKIYGTGYQIFLEEDLCQSTTPYQLTWLEGGFVPEGRDVPETELAREVNGCQ